ncbi:MAG: Tfp pilus assembly protein FimT/FimU [Pseudoxanthomonas sp.]
MSRIHGSPLSVRRPRGVTLIESVIVMAIVSLGLALGLPSFRSLVEQQRTQTAMHLLSAGFASARIAAVSGNTLVTVCPSNGLGGCRSGSDWSQGWLIFRDPRGTGQPASAAAIVREESASLDSSLRFVSTQGRPRIRFLPDGRSAGSNITVTLCRGGESLGQVVVNNLGRVRSTRPGDSKYCAG